MRAGGDLGETLIEILLTVVITGLTVTALISSLATAGNAGNVQRHSVQADIVMRNFAEATKLAVQQQCGAGATYTVANTDPDFTVAVEPAGGVCPPVDSAQLLTLVVTGPLGLEEKMQIRVRVP